MAFPWDDWQFWVVTVIFVVAAGYLLREVLPIPFFSSRARRRRRESKATLTISAKREGEVPAKPGEPPSDRPA
ncbi:MAG: hypothetical protein AB7K52_11710 [Phycisphaerales bacterium]